MLITNPLENWLIFMKTKSFKELKKEIISHFIPEYHKSYKKLGYYDLVNVLVDSKGRPYKLNNLHSKEDCYTIFTNDSKRNKVPDLSISPKVPNLIVLEKNIFASQNYKTFMLGDLLNHIRNHQYPETIKINPIQCKIDGKETLLCDDMVFAPALDQLTKQLIMTSPTEALPLLAINPQDRERFGFEVVFHLITNLGVPEDHEKRLNFLRTKIEELAFWSSRVPIKQGSGSIYCVMINLDNMMEEAAFIRSYKTFDNYADIIFVNSNLELLTGDLTSIPYNGNQIDTVFTPIINWQKSRQNIKHQDVFL